MGYAGLKRDYFLCLLITRAINFFFFYKILIPMDFSIKSCVYNLLVYWFVGSLVRPAGPVGPLRPFVSVVWLSSTSNREICYFLLTL